MPLCFFIHLEYQIINHLCPTKRVINENVAVSFRSRAPTPLLFFRLFPSTSPFILMLTLLPFYSPFPPYFPNYHSFVPHITSHQKKTSLFPLDLFRKIATFLMMACYPSSFQQQPIKQTTRTKRDSPGQL